jgi:hypothetical protein
MTKDGVKNVSTVEFSNLVGSQNITYHILSNGNLKVEFEDTVSENSKLNLR